METELWAIGLILFACLIGSFGPIFLKKGCVKIDKKRFIKTLFNYQMVIGGSFYVVSTILFIPALKGGELSVLYPLVATAYIWVSLLSVKFLNEKMNKYKWLGILFIIIGVSFIGFIA